ncbi:putative membrane protein At1g16860 [Silene latifolia]|uniref:putative membrane protein At1g16860 n=1 Tax=Silene latifolia TaxID=37657 RepID=UPI003D783080
MGSRFPSHKLSSGLYVSGRPVEQAKERVPTMSSAAMPYIGGDIKKSGELGKMFDIPVDGSRSRKSGPINNAPTRTGSFGGAASQSGPIGQNSTSRVNSGSVGGTGSASLKKSNSGPLNKHGEPVKKSSGPQGTSRQNSGPLAPVLPATGLITSGPISSGPLNSSGAPRKPSGPQDSTVPMKHHTSSIVHNQAVTKLSQDDEYSFHKSFPKLILWAMGLLFVMGFIAGGFILGAVHNPILLIVVVVLFSVVAAVFTWNTYWGRRAITGYIARYPDAELRTARDGQFVKVSGVVTCGNVPLESSFQKVPRCVYTSTSLYEYRGWDSKAANPSHRRFTWGLRSLERHVVDFYISDFQSGLRALVKTGYGARVTPYVDESVAIDIDPSNKDMSPDFVRWLGERNLSSDDRLMRLKEGYIKEGSTVSVMGVVQRNDNVLMIVPPSDPFPTGCQWSNCILPANLEGIVLSCEDTSKIDVIPV